MTLLKIIKKNINKDIYLNNKITKLIEVNYINYSIDTWKLLNIERILIDFKDEAFANQKWYSKPLFLYKNFFKNYIEFLYLIFFYFKIIKMSTIYYYCFDKKNLKFLKKQFFFFKNNINNIFIFSKIKNIQNLFNFFYFLKTLKLKKNFIFYKHKLLLLTFYSKNTLFKKFKHLFKNIQANLKLKSTKLHQNNLFKAHYFFYKKITYIKKNIIFNSIIKIKTFYNLKPILFFYKKLNTTASLLRKQKIYTKSKYSRARQYCKNIVLFGLLLNIILMFGLNSAYYAILINAGYFIYIVYFVLFIAAIFIFKKYKLLNKHSY